MNHDSTSTSTRSPIRPVYLASSANVTSPDDQELKTLPTYAAGSLSAIVLHSVPPLMVFAAAEAVTDLRDKLTEAATAAFTDAARRVDVEPRRPRPVRRGQGRRKLFDDYLAEARAVCGPGVVVTPAWVREVTGCSRGLSSRLAAALVAERDGGDAP